jgi:hypothetical protein
MSVVDIAASWERRARRAMQGARIVDVCHLSPGQARDVLRWSLRPPVLVLDNGLALFPARDAEGNDGGALHTTHPRLAILPPLRMEAVP